MITPATRTKTTRDLLTRLGIGQFNATMVIPFMFMAPATTDPKSPGVILLVRALQARLYQLGARITNTGYLDMPTAAVFEQLMGQGWMNRPWSAVTTAVLQAKAQPLELKRTVPETKILDQIPGDMAGFGGPLDFLPDVPGGLLTYAVGAYVAYRYLSKR